MESFRFLGTTISQDLKWDTHVDCKTCNKKSAEEVQPATGAAETVLLCHNWIRPLHINNCLVQLSYQIWPQKTTEGSPGSWANHWYNPPQSPRTVLIQSEQKGWQNHSGPLTSSTVLLWTVAPEHNRDRNSFFPRAIHLMNTWQKLWYTLGVWRDAYSTWRDETRDWVHENETRRDFYTIFKKSSMMKYMNGK